MFRITTSILEYPIVRKNIYTDFLRFMTTVQNDAEKESERLKEFRKKLREKTPIGKLEELEEGQHPYQEKEPLKPHPNNTNPETGEVGGPKGPEPTRYGDWERKGRVSDF